MELREDAIVENLRKTQPRIEILLNNGALVTVVREKIAQIIADKEEADLAMIPLIIEKDGKRIPCGEDYINFQDVVPVDDSSCRALWGKLNLILNMVVEELTPIFNLKADFDREDFFRLITIWQKDSENPVTLDYAKLMKFIDLNHVSDPQ
ncbi:MAG: hypothetical protein V2A63_04030 [Patescibacteria group bacterium]